MRALLFLFYLVETALNLSVVLYNIKGLLGVKTEKVTNKETQQLCNLAIVYFFTVLTMFASIDIGTGHMPDVYREIYRTGFASVSYIGISLLSMRAAEKDHYQTASKEGSGTHPFYMYMRAQSVAALVCGIMYSIHCIIMIDFQSSSPEDEILVDEEDAEEGSDDSSDFEEEVIIPVKLMVPYEDYLSQYEWFKRLGEAKHIDI